MKRLSTFLLTACLSVLLLSACGSKNQARVIKKEKDEEKKIYIVSTNDMHANIDNFPQFVALLDSLRAEHPNLLLFGAGDNRSGNPINDRYEEPSKPMYELMNAVGFNLSCFGNHEWDGGPLNLRKALTWASFPFVCANVSFDDTLQMPNVHPYVVFEREGLKIGVIGGIQVGENSLPDFHPNNGGGSHFVPLHDVLQQYIDELSDCNAIFLVSHCGYEDDRETAAMFPELNAIFGGHSHTRVEGKQMVGNVLVTQAESKLKYVTLSTFTFRNGSIVDVQSELLSILGCTKSNEEIKAMVNQYNSNEYFSTVVATNMAPVEGYESLGCLMTDAIRYTTGADMGFQNPGGVRFDTLSARPITLKDIAALDPFDNEIIAFTFTGQEIINLMKSCFITDNGPIYCSGCSYTYGVDDEGQMTNIKVTLENGKPLNLKAKYNIVMNNYMSTRFDFEHEDDGHSTFNSSNELMLKYLEQHPEIDYSKTTRVKEQ